MTPLFTGFPAIMYSGLWTLKKIGILRKEFSDAKIEILILVTDAPPAFMITIENGDFHIEIIDEINNVEDIGKVESEMYISIPSRILLGSVDGIFDGISKNLVKLNDEQILVILGKIASVF